MCRIFPNLLVFLAAIGVGTVAVWLSGALETETPTDVDRAEIIQAIEVVTDDAKFDLQPTKEDTPIIAEYNDTKPEKNNLVWVSSFHSEYFPYKNNSKWMGLFKEGDRFVVKPTRLRVKEIPDPDLYDLDVTTSVNGESIFLFRDLPGIKASEIPTVFLISDDEETDTSLKPGTQILTLNGVRYSLTLNNPIGGEYPGKGSTLTLAANGKEQVLRFLPDGCNECYWTLIWAGDLDADGKLDLLMDLTNHYNREDRVLFLSGEAGAGKLVKFFGNFWSVGC